MRLSDGPHPLLLNSAVVLGYALLAVGLAHGQALSRDQLLQPAWPDRGAALQGLRAAVENDPHDVQVSVALINALNELRGFDQAERASRTALSFNPDDPDLLLARARIVETPEALDVLAELARVPGHKKDADDMSEMMRLLPSHWQPPPYPFYIYRAWAAALVGAGKFDRAGSVLEEGIQNNSVPDEHTHQPVATPEAKVLVDLKPVVLAFRDHFDDAMALQKKQGYPQMWVAQYCGLADVLLLKGKPELAIESLGPDPLNPVPKPPRRYGIDMTYEDSEWKEFCDDLNQILACAYAETGNADKAVEMLANKKDLGDQLSLLSIYVEAKNKEAATKLGDQILSEHGYIHGGAYIGPFLNAYVHPASLKVRYESAITWLIHEHPQNEGGIRRSIGSPGQKPYESPFYFYFVPEPASLLIPKLRDKLAAVQKANDSRGILIATDGLLSVLDGSQHFKEAAQLSASIATEPPSQSGANPEQIRNYTLQWSTLNRKADTEVVFLAHPEVPRKADALFEVLEYKASGIGCIDDGLTEDARLDQVIQLGPAVISIATQRLDPNAIGPRNKSFYIRVIAAVGGKQDVPVLINALKRIAPAAAEEALEKLTGAKPPEGDPRDQVGFWFKWWDDNCTNVMGGK